LLVAATLFAAPSAPPAPAPAIAALTFAVAARGLRSPRRARFGVLRLDRGDFAFFDLRGGLGLGFGVGFSVGVSSSSSCTEDANARRLYGDRPGLPRSVHLLALFEHVGHLAAMVASA